MADSKPQTEAKSRNLPPSRKGKGPTPGSWKPGQSGNPGGRPRRAQAACEAVRERVDPHEWVEAELAIARDESLPWSERRDAWHALIDRGFVRAPAQLEATVSTGEPQYNVDALPIEQRRQLLETLSAIRTDGSSNRRTDSQPSEQQAESAHDDESCAGGVQ